MKYQDGPDDAPTPKESGTINRWSVFQGLALAIADGAERSALRAEKVVEEISLSRARSLRKIGKEARGLVEAFGAWEYGDPGPELRGGALTKLFELREEAQKFGVDTTGVVL